MGGEREREAMIKSKDRTKEEINDMMDKVMEGFAKVVEQKTGISAELLRLGIITRPLKPGPWLELGNQTGLKAVWKRNLELEDAVTDLLEAAKDYYERGYGSSVMRAKLGAAIDKAEGVSDGC